MNNRYCSPNATVACLVRFRKLSINACHMNSSKWKNVIAAVLGKYAHFI